MRALVNAPRSPGGLELRDVPPPDPAPNEAVVEVRAVSLNRGELTLLGIRPDGWRPGQDVSGIVRAPAADGSGPKGGAPIVAWVDQAGWAEQVAAETGRVVQLPDQVELAAAATLPVAGLTALRTVRLGGHLVGRRVLVTGAAGGVGRFAIRLAALSGAKVTAVARNEERAAGLEDLGVAGVVNDVEEADGRYDLILESAGGRSLSSGLERLAEDGVLVMFGNSSKEPSEIRFDRLAGSPRARIETFRVYESGEPPSFGFDLRLLVSLLASGRLEAHIGLESSWQEAGAALEALRERRVKGKAVLRVDGA